MSSELLQILAAGFSGIGFAMMFHIRPRHLPVAFIGAALGWALYMGAGQIWPSRSIAMMAAAFGVTAYSEAGARVVRMPASVIYTPAIIPLIPGSYLYYCMRGFVTDSREVFLECGGLLLEDTLSIVLGSMIVLTFVSAVRAKKNQQTRS